MNGKILISTLNFTFIYFYILYKINYSNLLIIILPIIYYVVFSYVDNINEIEIKEIKLIKLK